MASRLEVAEAMYQAGKGGPGPKMPESLDEVARATQERYLLLAEAAISVTGEPVAIDAGLLDDLAGELAFKLNHPQQFHDGVRDVLARYAEHVGPDRLDGEVRKAMEI